MSLSMMVICIKQYLSNIWSRIHGKVKQHWGWVKRKRVAYRTKACIYDFLFITKLFQPPKLFSYLEKVINLVLLESHGRVEYWRGKYFRQKKTES